METNTAHSDTQSINREACAWIVKLDSSEPTPADRAALTQWMNQSPRHKAEIQRLAKLWGQLNVLGELAVPYEVPHEAPHQLPQTAPAPYRRSLLIAPLAIAATLIVTVGLLFQSGLLNRLLATGPQVYITAVGEQKRVPLPDGSTLLLNTNSRAEVDYTAAQRRIRLLHGQAHFEVEHDADRPFLVYAGKGVVRAVGTAFSVYVKRGGLDVTVTEGTVELKTAAESPNYQNQQGDLGHETPREPATAPANKADSSEVDSNEADSNPPTIALVTAGQRAIADSVIESIQTVEKAQLEKDQSWREGVLRFSGEPLEKVIEEISRYTPQSIVIDDPALRNLRFGGVFPIGETDKMFAALESGFGVQVERVHENLVKLSL